MPAHGQGRGCKTDANPGDIAQRLQRDLIDGLHTVMRKIKATKAELKRRIAKAESRLEDLCNIAAEMDPKAGRNVCHAVVVPKESKHEETPAWRANGSSSARFHAAPTDNTHFLGSFQARSLCPSYVAQLSEEEAWELLRSLRWASTNGSPICVHCNGSAVYEHKRRRLYSCKACGRQFSVTSGTTLASYKMHIRDYLIAVALFHNAPEGYTALQMSRDLHCRYRTAQRLLRRIADDIARTGQQAAPVPRIVGLDNPDKRPAVDGNRQVPDHLSRVQESIMPFRHRHAVGSGRDGPSIDKSISPGYRDNIGPSAELTDGADGLIE